MAIDTPANQAPDTTNAVAEFYVREGATPGDGFNKLDSARVAYSGGMTVADKGKTFYVDLNGEVAKLAPANNGDIQALVNGLPSWGSGLNFTLGVFSMAGTASAGSEIRLFEDTDNGTNYTGLKAANAIGSSITFTLPSADGTPGQALVTDGSGTLGFGTSGITAADARRIANKYALIV